MLIRSWITCAIIVCLCSCASKAPASCCAAIGYTRAQVESAVGPPSPPQSSKYHPLPSPPPGTAIYTTEHGYLTVMYVGKALPVAVSMSLDFYEGKDPATAFALIAPFVPNDAVSIGVRTSDSRAQTQMYQSVRVKDAIKDHGYFFVTCVSPNPARECDRMEIGTPRRVSGAPKS